MVAPTCQGKDDDLISVAKIVNFFLVKYCFQDQVYHNRCILNYANVFKGNETGIVFVDIFLSGVNKTEGGGANNIKRRHHEAYTTNMMCA